MFDDSISKGILKKKYGEEEVLVFTRDLASKFHDMFTPKKFRTEYYPLQNISKHVKYIKRYDAEYNYAVMQLISYILIVNHDNTKIFVSKRIAGDKRLKGTLSFFGGHINPCDMSSDIAFTAANRELNEEVRFQRCKNTLTEYMGVVRDDSGNTSEHLGVVFYAFVNWAKVREVANLEGTWMNFDQLINNYGYFENWARYIIDYIFVQNQISHTKTIIPGIERN